MFSKLSPPQSKLVSLLCPTSLRVQQQWMIGDLGGCRFSVDELARTFDLLPDTVSVSNHTIESKPPLKLVVHGVRGFLLIPSYDYVVHGVPSHVSSASRIIPPPRGPSSVAGSRGSVASKATTKTVSASPVSAEISTRQPKMQSCSTPENVLNYKKFQTYPEQLADLTSDHPARRAFRKYAGSFDLVEDTTLVKKNVPVVVATGDKEVRDIPVLVDHHEVYPPRYAFFLFVFVDGVGLRAGSKAIQQAHGPSHCGREQTEKHVKEHYFIENLRVKVTQYIRTCPVCVSKSRQVTPRMQTYIQTQHPRDLVRCLCFISPLKNFAGRACGILTLLWISRYNTT